MLAQISILTKGTPNEIHTRSKPLTGIKKVAFSKPMSITSLRTFLKQK